MTTVGLNSYLILSILLFAIGFFGVLLRKNTLIIYMCLELMLVAATIALVAFSRFNGTLDGNVFVFFILTVAAAEVAVGLAKGNIEAAIANPLRPALRRTLTPLARARSRSGQWCTP